MSAGRASPQLDALRALLTTAQQLSNDLAADPVVGRLLHAFLGLPPEDRDVVTSVVERGATWKRVTDHTAELTGVRLRANPQARLFVHVVDPEGAVNFAAQDHDELLLGALRLARVATLLEDPGVRALWTQPAIEAFRMVEPADREACVRLARSMIELITSIDQAPGPESTST